MKIVAIILFVAVVVYHANGLDKKVVCYWPNWMHSTLHAQDIDANLCTHINYAFASLDSNSLTIKFRLAAGEDNKLVSQLLALKKKNPDLKLLISMGGYGDSAGDKYSRLVNSADARHNFVRHVVGFLKQHHFDGLDIDWEFPKCWQANCERGPDSDKKNFASLVHELREEFDKQNPHFLL